MSPSKAAADFREAAQPKNKPNIRICVESNSLC